MDNNLSIYGHDKATDPRYAPVNGRVPVGAVSYYACCETEEPPCDKVAFHLPDGSSTEFLLGNLDSLRPRQLWWKRAQYNFSPSGPHGVRLLRLMAQLPCTQHPDETHQWWEWEWDRRWWQPFQYSAWRWAFGPGRFTAYPFTVQYCLFGLWPRWTVTGVYHLKEAVRPWLRPFMLAKEQPNA